MCEGTIFLVTTPAHLHDCLKHSVYSCSFVNFTQCHLRVTLAVFSKQRMQAKKSKEEVDKESETMEATATETAPAPEEQVSIYCNYSSPFVANFKMISTCTCLR